MGGANNIHQLRVRGTTINKITPIDVALRSNCFFVFVSRFVSIRLRRQLIYTNCVTFISTFDFS